MFNLDLRNSKTAIIRRVGRDPAHRRRISGAGGRKFLTGSEALIALAGALGWTLGGTVTEFIAWLIDKEYYWQNKIANLELELEEARQQLQLIQDARQQAESADPGTLL